MRLKMLEIILGMGFATYLTRAGSLLLLKRTGLSHSCEKWVKYIPLGILTGLITPTVLIRDGILDISINNHYLLAAVTTAIIAYRSRNVLISMAAGMFCILILRWTLA